MSSRADFGPIVQIAVVVSDIETKARAWADLFGMAVPDVVVTDASDTARTRYLGEPTPARAKLAFFQFDGLAVELIEPIDGPSTWRDHLEAHGDSLHHIAFRIKGMTGVLATLSGQGGSRRSSRASTRVAATATPTAMPKTAWA